MPVIAVDGPAASGKGTIGRALARHFGLPHMDTGLLYRAVALNLWRWGGDPGNEFEALRALRRSRLRSRRPGAQERAGVEDRLEHLGLSRRSAPPCSSGSRISPRQRGGAVLDGRDIGTVIAPGADVKLFVTASPEVRAERRMRELESARNARAL